MSPEAFRVQLGVQKEIIVVKYQVIIAKLLTDPFNSTQMNTLSNIIITEITFA